MVNWGFGKIWFGVIGKTSAEQAGINLNLGRNRCMGLIEQSL